MKKLLAACAAVFALAGCTSTGATGIYDLPLPGGADLGDHPYHVTVEFADVLDLVPQAAVKVNDVVVGRVEEITLGGADRWTPQVVVAVNGDVRLPADATASLRQSSLLGEKFVELAAPTSGDKASRLEDGAVITADRTNRHTEVEEVFGALSLLLNGGGIGQLRTINQELTKTLSGNEPEIKAFLTNVNQLVTTLDDHRGDITDALDGLNQLSATLAGRNEQITGALTNLTPGLQALSDQRTALVTMLQSLDALSDVAVDTINKSRDDMVADLQALAPVLGRLADAGQYLPQALEILPTFPFTDEVLNARKGDYINIFLSVTPVANFPAPLPPLPIPEGN
ncbi:MCE family protein [Actinophytocola oryzae]|uniref:Phospholipid/cholesterol/gamma-HCH transport system substrate-binding protein n=1 Tax=Actinophytocola oryzae TaxID=502181 RepID=A0A4R7UX58_9PSEU|nr:MCE family protein [Actinophytocola oryzae]TDV41389.1 phospholipid/cholesterol/gamma-HCH transport system substrate-binding protein [Actinophytocola oryzae]